MVRAHIVVKGRVQGVGFRWFVERTANRFGLVGTVENLANGDVEVFVEGSRSSIDELIAILKKGNTLSRVDQLNVSFTSSDASSESKYDQFRIISGLW